MSFSTHELICALADGKFHTGEGLGQRFGVTKTAVWKAVKKLAELGLDVHSVRGKGYRLSEPLTLLDEQSILGSVAPQWREQVELELLHCVDSTNLQVMRYLRSPLFSPGTGNVRVCMSEMQTSGKGRRGRQWVSPFGNNIYFSMVREFSNGAAGLDGLSLVVGLALVQVLKEMGIGGLKLKWPNDILCGEQKLAGILLEINGDVSGECQVVIGLGLNLKTTPSEMVEVGQPWTALDALGFAQGRRNQLAGSIISGLLAALDTFEIKGFAAFRDDWEQFDITRGRNLQLSSGLLNVEGVGAGVSDTGALQIQTEAGLQVFNGGEVSLRFSRRTDLPSGEA